MELVTQPQRYVLAISKICSATLSLISSCLIIYKVFLRYQEHKKRSTSCVRRGSIRSNAKHDEITTYHRMLVGVSILDIMYSFWAASGIISVPSASGDVFARGTIATCSTQAFFVQLVPSIVLYMAALNTYFMLKIRYNVSDAVITKHYEIWFHAIPIAVWLFFGTLGLSLKIFGPIGLPEFGCWLGSYPYGCAFTDTCTRGYQLSQYLDWYAWTFVFMWFFLSFIVILVNSILIFTAIRKQEQRNAKYLGDLLQGPGTTTFTNNTILQPSSFVLKSQGSIKSRENDIAIAVLPMDDHERPNSEAPVDTVVPDAERCDHTVTHTPIMSEDAPFQGRNNDGYPSAEYIVVAQKLKQSRTAAVQSSLFCGLALFTAVWLFLIWLFRKFMVLIRVYFFMALLVNIVLPSQGIFNLFIFVRLQYLKLRATNQDWNRLRCIKQCLFSAA
jgi:hypothetical protein